MTLQAMKEQQDQIKTLQVENADLKARLERLEQLMLAKEALAQR